MKKKILFIAILACFSLAFLLPDQSWARNEIPLRYETVGHNLLGCDYSIAVVEFDDNRPMETIGQTQDGDPLYPGSNVSKWITKALFDELDKGGCSQAGYIQSMETAQDRDFIIHGKVEEVFIKKTSIIGYSVDIRINVALQQDDEVVQKKEYSASLEKKTFPTPSKAIAYLQSTLQDLMKQVVADLHSKMREAYVSK